MPIAAPNCRFVEIMSAMPSARHRTSTPLRLRRGIRLTTPATASEPYTAEAPSAMTSTRSRPSDGMIDGSTERLLSTARWPSMQGQRGVRPDAANVDRVAEGDVVAAPGLPARILGRAEVEDLRDFLQDAVSGDRARCFDRGAIDRDNGRADRRGAANAAAGDDDVGGRGVGRDRSRRGGARWLRILCRRVRCPADRQYGGAAGQHPRDRQSHIISSPKSCRPPLQRNVGFVLNGISMRDPPGPPLKTVNRGGGETRIASRLRWRGSAPASVTRMRCPAAKT